MLKYDLSILDKTFYLSSFWWAQLQQQQQQQQLTRTALPLLLKNAIPSLSIMLPHPKE